MQKGQVAIEFIFILLIIIIYLFTVTMPIVESAQDAIIDIERIVRISNETEKLSKNINEIYFLGTGSRQTINVFIPNYSTINCYENENKIGFTTQININQINPNLAICPNNICDHNLNLFSGIILRCSQENFVTGNYQISVDKIEENEINISMVS